MAGPFINSMPPDYYTNPVGPPSIVGSLRVTCPQCGELESGVRVRNAWKDPERRTVTLECEMGHRLTVTEEMLPRDILMRLGTASGNMPIPEGVGETPVTLDEISGMEPFELRDVLGCFPCALRKGLTTYPITVVRIQSSFGKDFTVSLDLECPRGHRWREDGTADQVPYSALFVRIAEAYTEDGGISSILGDLAREFPMTNFTILEADTRRPASADDVVDAIYEDAGESRKLPRPPTEERPKRKLDF